MNTLQELIHARHLAFVRAIGTEFANAGITQAWRDANRAYVRARAAEKARLKASPITADRLGANAAA